MSRLQLRLIKKLLDENRISYEISEHEPVYTSEQAACVRGAELRTGVKALVLETKEGNLVVGLVAADRRVDLKKLAKVIGTKNLRLSSPRKVLKTTGCEVGSVHPFGNIHKIPTYMDLSVLENVTVNFNAGLHTVSIQMKSEELTNIVKPRIENFSIE